VGGTFPIGRLPDAYEELCTSSDLMIKAYDVHPTGSAVKRHAISFTTAEDAACTIGGTLGNRAVPPRQGCGHDQPPCSRSHGIGLQHGDRHHPARRRGAAPGGHHPAVGYPHVVATLWSIEDFEAPGVTDGFCRRLSAEGRPRSGGAEQALHESIVELRRSAADEPLVWAPYVHFGP
jgi:hypothetical protein